jgi:hypothetical protein
MSKVIRPERVFNGSWSSLWIDDEEMAEATAVEAKLSLEKTEVNQTGTLAKGYKVTGTDGKGSIKMNKISSYFINKIAGNIQDGKTTVCQIRSKIADPDAVGAEDILLTGVTFDEVELVNWESKKLLEENIPFSFTGFEVLESVDHSTAIS